MPKKSRSSLRGFALIFALLALSGCSTAEKEKWNRVWTVITDTEQKAELPKPQPTAPDPAPAPAPPSGPPTVIEVSPVPAPSTPARPSHPASMPGSEPSDPADNRPENTCPEIEKRFTSAFSLFIRGHLTPDLDPGELRTEADNIWKKCNAHSGNALSLAAKRAFILFFDKDYDAALDALNEAHRRLSPTSPRAISSMISDLRVILKNCADKRTIMDRFRRAQAYYQAENYPLSSMEFERIIRLHSKQCRPLRDYAREILALMNKKH